jgi:hypothetical protein
MRVISYLSTFLMVAFLAACGGGGGSPGLSSGATPTTTAFFTTVPSAGLTLAKGVSNSFAIGGGTPPYLATSSNLAIASGSVNGTVLSIAGVGAGATSIDVRDSAGATKAVTVTVTESAAPTPVTMFTTAPSNVSIANGTTVSYTITGGKTPYTVTSDDLSVLRATVSGSNLSVSAVGGGSANLTIKDADGASSISIAVTVGSSTKFFMNAPGSVNMVPGASATYLLSGGTAPYSVVSSDVRVANGGIVGTALTVSAVAVGSASLQITDASGTSLTLSITVAVPPSTTAVSQDPVLKSPTLRDAAGLTTNSLAASGNTLLSVTLTDPSGLGIPNQVIDVAGDPTQVVFPEGSAGLTNSSGVATIKVARASLLASGAGSLTLTYSYKVGAFAAYPNGSLPPTANKVITTYIGYQLSASNITLTNLDVGTGTLAAYGTRQVSVQANVNGVPATGTPVQVNFTASCGQISPATASTNSSGLAVVSYTATDALGTTPSTLGCSGKTVEITASTVGATVVSRTLNIAAAPATNLSFVSATPSRIYLDGAGGPTQSIVEFKLVNARGEAILGQDVSLTLKTLNGGIPKASIGSVGSLAAVRITTDADGKVSVPVFSGTVPTSVLVNAALVSNPLIQTDSAVLTIASGRPAQMRVSLSIGERAIRGFNFDGSETTVTLSLADRQGNPVPDGTAVNFVTEGGVMIPPVCTTGGVAGNSQCNVKIRTQNPRPVNGLVTILAYAAGEEDFVDANFNNVFDCGEAYTDLGIAYRDDTATVLGAVNAFVTGEFSVPRSASASACATGVTPSPTVGDGVWGAADVRMQTIVVFSTDDLNILSPTWTSVASAQWGGTVVASQLDVSVQDLNGNSVPTGSTIAALATDTSIALPTTGGATPVIGTCSVSGQSHVAVPNSLSPLPLSIYLKDCVTGDQVKVTVTTSAGVKAITFAVP